jgi:hypothetical protein
MVYHAISLKNTTEEQNRPMPIAVRNELPTINLVLGKYDDHATLTVELSVLFDTCGATSTGYKPYHDRIRKLHPDVVHDYGSFDDANRFNPIKLTGAVRDPTDTSKEVVGELTAVIPYKTPYIYVKGHPILLWFALGDSVSFNTIPGIPAIDGMKLLWNIRKKSITAVALQSLNNTFTVSMKGVEYGIPKRDRIVPTENEYKQHLNHQAKPIHQYHFLDKNHQWPFGGPNGRIARGKSLNFAEGSKLPPLRTFQAIPFTGPSFGSEPAPVSHTLLIDAPTKIWRPK